MGLSHYILVTLNCVSYSPKWARLWAWTCMQLVYLKPPASRLLPLLGFTPARELGATAKAVTITQWVTSATCLVLVEPYHSFPLTPLSSTEPCSLSFIRCPWNISILGFLYCTDVFIQAACGGCLLLAELNYYLKISPVPAVPSLTVPKTFDHRELNHSNYTSGVFSDVGACTV